MLTQYEKVTLRVLFGNALLDASMPEENTTPYLKMANVQDKAMCVLCFFITKSVTKRQGRRTQYRKDPPSDTAIRRWYSNLKRLAVFCATEKWEDRTFCRKMLIESRERFLQAHRNQVYELLCS
jgi:hypothetical protein